MLNLFVTLNEEGDLIPTTGGYTALAVLVFVLLIVAAKIAGKRAVFDTKKLAFCAISLAIATVLSMIPILKLYNEGSATPCSMLFVVLIGYWFGPAVGLCAGVAYGILQFILGPYILSLPQVLVDYPFAFGALGLSGFFAGRKNGLIPGYIVSVLGRFFFATLSGVIFFGMWAPEGMHPLLYSVLYNGSYLGVELVITVILLAVPAVRSAIARITAMARQDNT